MEYQRVARGEGASLDESTRLWQDCYIYVEENGMVVNELL